MSVMVSNHRKPAQEFIRYATSHEKSDKTLSSPGWAPQFTTPLRRATKTVPITSMKPFLSRIHRDVGVTVRGSRLPGFFARVHVGVLLGSLAAVLLPQRAWAADPTDAAPALSAPSGSGPSVGRHEVRRTSFESAMRAMQEERWPEARELLIALWSEKPSYDVALNLGLVEYNLEHYREAAEALAYGLENVPPREDTATAQRAEQVLGLCEARLGIVDLIVANAGATVLVDGRIVPASARVAGLFVTPGAHDFEVRLEGFEPEAWSLTLHPGERQSRSVTLLPERAHGEAASVAGVGAGSGGPADPGPVAPRPWYRGWTPVIAGGAVTLVGVSMGFAFESLRSTESEDAAALRDQVGEHGCAGEASASSDCRALRDANSSYDSYGRYELGSFIVAGLGLVGTTAYFFMVRPDQDSRDTAGSETSLRFGARVAPRGSELLIGGTF